MEENLLCCPVCESLEIKKNGHTFYGKQNYQCKSCGCQFVENGRDWFESESDKELINNLLLERISLGGICRVCNVSKSWLLLYIKELYGQLPDDLYADTDLPDIEEYLDERFEEEIGRIETLKKNQLYLKNTKK